MPMVFHQESAQLSPASVVVSHGSITRRFFKALRGQHRQANDFDVGIKLDHTTSASVLTSQLDMEILNESLRPLPYA